MVPPRASPCLVLLVLLTAGLAGVPPVVAQDNPGAQDQSTLPLGDPFRYNVGLARIPRDLDPGDLWKGAEVLLVNRPLGFITVRSLDPGFPHTTPNDPDVRYVEPDEVRTIDFVPNDPSWSNQYGPDKINAELVWDNSLGTTDKNVCIVDTGIRYTHDDLTGARWLGGYDFVNSDSNPWDDQGHGTHVAGIAAASTNNGKGIAGVAQVGIKAAKVLNSGGSGYDSWVASGIQWCADNDGHVINLSLGGPSGSSTLSNAVTYAWDEGAVVVAAAGNDGPCSNCVGYPARYTKAIAVSCTTSTNAQCSFSSDGPEVDLAAPGYDIYATCYGSNTNYCYKSGTSMSTPHVAGAAALIWSLLPYSTNAEIRDLLEENAKDLGATGWDQLYGWGLVDAKAALDAAGVLYPQDPILVDDFDDGSAQGWTLTGQWRVSSVCGGAASAPNYLGFHQASSCTYDNFVNPTSGEARFDVDLTQMLQATLIFKHRWETESNSQGAYDIMRVQVSTNNGASWSTLASWDTRDANQPGWSEQTYLLNDYVGTQTRIRFWFDTVDGLSNNHDGWHVDDVRVTAADNFPPIALAGPDRSATDSDGSGDEPVAVDGSASRDRNDGGAIVSYEWRLGETLLGTGATPILTVPVGTNTITLTVTDDGGATATDTVLVTVLPNTPPIAHAGADVAAGDPDADGTAVVALDGTASTDGDGTIASYAWTEDGTTLAAGATPDVSLAVGVHDITLTVTDDGGATASDVVRVTVSANVPPAAAAGADVTGSDGDADGTVQLTLDGSGSTDPDGHVVAYAWTSGGETVGSGPMPTVALPLGTHALTLTVTDDGGATATDDLTVTIEGNHAPVAVPGPDFGVRDLGGDGVEDVTLDGTASTDDDGTLVAYEWREGDVVLGTGAVLTTPLAFGAHTVTLIVTDDGGATASASQLVSVLDDVPPTAVFTYSCAGLACAFDASASTDDGSLVTYAWTFGDGESAAGPGATRTHTYAATGTYEVCLTATDDGGFSDDVCHTLTLSETYLRIDFDDATAGPMTLTGLWRIDALCATPRSAPKYLGYHKSGACSFHTGSAASGSATFTVDLSGNTAPVLDFWHRWETYSSSSLTIHRQYVQARATGTTSWSTLGYWDARDPNQLAWKNQQFSLAAYAGGQVDIRFHFEPVFSSSFYNQRPGWHIDWVQVGQADAIVHPPTPPVAHAGADVTDRDLDGDGVETVTLDGGTSSDLDGSIVAYAWREQGVLLGTGSALTHAFGVGTHTIVLTVTDDAGLSATDAVVVTVLPNAPPVADAGEDVLAEDADGDGAQLFTLEGGASQDDGPIVAYAWRQGAATLGTASTLQHAFPVGVHTITLEVEDLAGATASDAVQVTVVANEPPVAVAGADQARNDDDRDGTEPIVLDGRGSYDPVGGIVAWEWTSDGSPIGSVDLLSYDFPVGVHDVVLTVRDASGATATDALTVTITANRPPVAAFLATCSVVACDLDASASHDPDGDPLSYTWSYSDGQGATGETTWHAFPSAGLFTICLTVADWGLSTMTCQTVHLIATTFLDGFDDGSADGWVRSGLWRVSDQCSTPPSAPYYLGYHLGLLCMYQELGQTSGAAAFEVDLSQGTTGFLRFDHRWITESTSGDTARDVMRVQLSRNDGATWFTLRLWDSRDANQPNWGTQVLALDAHAGYDLKIRFHFDSYNALHNHYQGWQIDNVEVVSDAPAPNKAPTAVFSSACTDLDCGFDASDSYDFPGGVVVHYAWQFGDGTTGTGMAPSHAYTANGTYTVRLTVTDNGGMTATTTRTVTVSGMPATNAPPFAGFTHDADGLTVSFDATSSSDPDGDTLVFAWDFGDGAGDTGPTAQHTYAEPGSYPVTLTVSDGQAEDVEARMVNAGLANQPPVADFVYASAGLSVDLDATRSSDPDADALTYTWGLGDGTQRSGLTVAHTYAAPGDYTVELTVEDPGGLTDGHSVLVHVEDDVLVTGPPTAPPDDPQVTDDTYSGPAEQVPWMDVRSVWFDSDRTALFVGMAVRDIPSPDRVTAQVKYHVGFVPHWSPIDPTHGGRIPVGETVSRYEVRAVVAPVGSPLGSTARDFELWAFTRDATQAQHERLVAQLEGQSTATAATDIFWWHVPRGLLQAPLGAELSAPRAEAHPSADGLVEMHGVTADSTGTGSGYTF